MLKLRGHSKLYCTHPYKKRFMYSTFHLFSSCAAPIEDKKYTLNELHDEDIDCIHPNNEKIRNKKLVSQSHYPFGLVGNKLTSRNPPQSREDFFRIRPRRVPLDNVTNSRNLETAIQVDSMQNHKLSHHGTQDALFLDCLDRINEARRHIHMGQNKLRSEPAPEIEELKQTEKEMIYKLLKRVDPNKTVAPNIGFNGKYIDPFWNPFNEVDDIKDEISREFSAYARLSNVAEAIEDLDLIRRRYQSFYGLCNPLRKIEDKTRLRTNIPEINKYPQMSQGVPSRFWDPSTVRRQALYNHNRPITWRDLHILTFFIAESGAILPRCLTMATRRQQKRIFKAIKLAQYMGLFPTDWKPVDTEKMRLVDPLQFLTDVMTTKLIKKGCLRAKAMVQAAMRRSPTLDARRYLQHQSKMQRLQNKITSLKKKEKTGNFSNVLQRYMNPTEK